MARTIKEIANGMKAEFVGSEALRTHYGLDDFNANVDYVEFYNSHFSAVSVETCLIYVVAWFGNALETVFDLFKKEVDETVANERYGHKEWYRTKAREFHYTDLQRREEIYPIAQVSVEEQAFGILMKVAKGEPGSLSKLTDEKEAFESWMNRQKPAGIPIRYISCDPDKLWLKIEVFYDPVYIRQSDVNDGINSAITAHLQSIDFNAEFTTMALVDDLQKLKWLDLVEIHEVHVQPTGYEYETVSGQNARNTPVSGWYELDTERMQIVANPI